MSNETPEAFVPGQTYVEQLQKVQLLTILLREKVRDPAYMEPILARWYQLEMNFQDKLWKYDFLEHDVDGQSTGFLMGHGVEQTGGAPKVLIFAYGGVAETWPCAKGGVCGVYFNRGLEQHRVPADKSINIPEAVWQRAAQLL